MAQLATHVAHRASSLAKFAEAQVVEWTLEAAAVIGRHHVTVDALSALLAVSVLQEVSACGYFFF
jgi:hypothetical protein